MKKNIKPYITVESLLNFIKKDLRNLEVEYLIIDLLVLQVDEPNSIEEAMEAFQMLNKNGKVIVSALGEEEEIRKQWNDFCLGKYEFIFQEDEVHSEVNRKRKILR